MDLIERVKQLCCLNGTSGDEQALAAQICKSIGEHASCFIDPMGNVLVHKQGRKKPKQKLLFAAHMDEVGFIITHITAEGFLAFAPVGGIDSGVAFGRKVRIGEKKIPGVIAGLPIHLLDAEEKKQVPAFDKLYIDIGASSKEEAEKAVRLGDRACFEADFASFGDGFLRSKALDDRAGCAIMLDMICSELEYDADFAFTVQEEVGLRGAKAAAYTMKPDIAIILETTTAGDIAGSTPENSVCNLGLGATLSVMDGRTIFDKELVDQAFSCAEKENIPCQYKRGVAGGNDGASVQISCGGVRTMVISVPTRYLHSGNCVCKESDIYAVRKLALAMLPVLLG